MKIGDRGYFYPGPVGDAIPTLGSPCVAAVVAFVHESGQVNVAAISAFGSVHSRQFVTVAASESDVVADGQFFVPESITPAVAEEQPSVDPAQIPLPGMPGNGAGQVADPSSVLVVAPNPPVLTDVVAQAPAPDVAAATEVPVLAPAPVPQQPPQDAPQPPTDANPAPTTTAPAGDPPSAA